MNNSQTVLLRIEARPYPCAGIPFVEPAEIVFSGVIKDRSLASIRVEHLGYFGVGDPVLVEDDRLLYRTFVDWTIPKGETTSSQLRIRSVRDKESFAISEFS